ncbi:NAD(P)H-dependent flavin oxidoreductase [Sphingobium nicotianae]|uniref:NAD(P)H-dependent flavin oxidoreductase n=1 Tax=Sphingobium nicotianae TaxID=2782607 RepID=UPI0032D94AAA
MARWPAASDAFLALTGAQVPIVQAPMAGAGGVALAIAAMKGGAVGSLPAATISAEQLRAQIGEVRGVASGPLNINFFCHHLPEPPDESAWRALLAPYYAQEGVGEGPPAPLRRPFDAAMCAIIEEARPQIVSFHFGLPEAGLLARVRATGAVVLASATTREEVRFLAARGCDAIILQGAEAGGHSGWFLGERHEPTPLAELLRERVDVPVIAAGGIVDGADMAAALQAGASAVQIGTAYLATPQSLIAPPFRALLGTDAATDAAFTNLFSGREARGIRNRLMRELGAIRAEAPAFPYASNAITPLRATAEAAGRNDYSSLWVGAGATRVRPQDAEALTRAIAQDAQAHLETMNG